MNTISSTEPAPAESQYSATAAGKSRLSSVASVSQALGRAGLIGMISHVGNYFRGCPSS